MKRSLKAAIVGLLAFLPAIAHAQTSPNWSYRYVPTTAEWNAQFSGKQDYLGAPPLLTTGGVMIGPLITAPSATANAGFNIAPGVAPTAPNDGDMWATTGGLFVRINGSTIGPLAQGTSGSFTGSSPIVVSFPGGGVVNYACSTCGVTGNPLSQFASTTSSQLAGIISDETGTGPLVFSGSPTLTGTLTAAAANFSGAVNFTSTFKIGGTTETFPTSGLLVGTTDAQTLTNKTLASSTDVLGGVTTTLGSDATGDIYYRSSGGLLTRLPIGSSSALLTVSGGLPAWLPAAGGGNVSNTGTPTANQIAQWTSSTVIKGTNLASLLTAGSGISISGTTSPTINAFNVVPSRAFAITQNLSAFSVITTQGYATAGDGGGATFKNVGTAAFADTYISGVPTITTAGSGLANNPYLGVHLTGGSSAGCMGSATVAGNVLTGVSIAVPCAGYKVGDVLTIPTSDLGGSGVAPTLTVGAISTPQASFTDSAGTHWQFVTDQPGNANILQFGAKPDWFGSDGSATNNSPAAWSAASWASNQNSSASAQVYGNQIIWPKGAYMFCGTWNGTQFGLPIPAGVRFSGIGVGGTTLMECAADPSNMFPYELCDSNSQFGQYGCKIENMILDSQQVTTSTAGTASIYSNSGQQFVLGENLEIQPGQRGCVRYDIGKGGASNDIWLGIDCEMTQGNTNPGYFFNASSTQHYLLHGIIGCTGTGCSIAINNSNGRLIADGLELEDFSIGLFQNVSTSGNNSVYRNIQQNSNNCSTGAIALSSGNTPGNLLLENVATTCAVTVSNGQSGGTNWTGNIRGPLMCVSGACAAAVP